MACQGGFYGDVGSFPVADFADEHDVGVLTQHRAQNPGERQPLRDVHVTLVHACKLVFDRVFGRDDVDVRLVEVLKARVQRRRLARARRPCYEDNAVRLVDGEFHRLVRVFIKAERRKPRRKVRLVEDTHNDFLAMNSRENRNANVDLFL